MAYVPYPNTLILPRSHAATFSLEVRREKGRTLGTSQLPSPFTEVVLS